MAARISFEDTYFHAYNRLQREPACLADGLVAACERDPAAVEPYLISVPEGHDRQIRLVNIGEGYSVVLRVGAEREGITVLWVGHRDKARRWAARWEPQPTIPRPRRAPAAAAVKLPAHDDPLSAPLWMIGLPARMENWAEGAGVGPLGELVRRHPSDLAREKRVGKVSIDETRALIQKLTGQTWESLAAPHVEPRSEERQPEEAPEAVAWDRLRKALAHEDRGLTLASIPLPNPARIYAHSERLQTLGDLAEQTPQDLLCARQLGPRALQKMVDAIAQAIEARRSAGARAADQRRLAERGLLESLEQMASELAPVPRKIVMRRAGLGCEPGTLQEIGSALGYSRERVRQYLASVRDEWMRRSWAEHVRERVSSAVRNGGVALEDLASDRWWRRAAKNEHAVRYVVEELLGTAHVTTVAGRRWITKAITSEIEAATGRMRAAVRALPAPFTLRRAKAAALRAADPIGPRVAAELWSTVRNDAMRIAGRAEE